MSPLRKNILSLLVIALGFALFFQSLSWLLPLAPEPIGSRSGLFVEGAKLTLQLTAVSGISGFFLGAILGLSKLSRLRAIRWPAQFVVWIIRGTPLLVQIMFVFYAVPSLIPATSASEWLHLSDFSAAAVALSINIGAYNAEIFRAGILAVPIGQTEAAHSLGLSSFQSLRYVVFPQAFKVMVPPLMNNVVALLKDSSLASSIGLLELTLAGNRVSSETFLPIPVLTTVTVIYLLMTTAITTLATSVENHLNHKRSLT